MSNGDYKIDPETWRHMEIKDQLWMIYQTFNERREKCNAKFDVIRIDHKTLDEKVDRNKYMDRGTAGLFGFIGGIIGVLGRSLFK